MKRGFHTKSRSGCKRCKTRKVKCDEAAPCRACVKHRVRCSLAPDVPPLPEGHFGEGDGDGFVNQFSQDFIGPSPSSSKSRSSSIGSLLSQASRSSSSHRIPEPVPYIPRFLANVHLGGGEDWASNLELLHHYNVAACKTMSSGYLASKTLQVEVLQLGVDHDFLLQQILAFSGFHLSYVQPDKRRTMTLKASRHQSVAIAGLRATLAGEITQDNCHALFSCSILLLTTVFAALPSHLAQNKSLCVIDSIIDMMKLDRGIPLILSNAYGPLREGPLKDIFATKRHEALPFSEPVQRLIKEVEAIKPHVQALAAEVAAEEAEDCSYLLSSLIGMLVKVHGAVSLSDTSFPEIQATFAWPMTLSNEHLEMIQARRPLALVALSYYGVLLKITASRAWFLVGWGEALMDSILRYLGGTEYEALMEWPRRFIQGEAGSGSCLEAPSEGFLVKGVHQAG